MNEMRFFPSILVDETDGGFEGVAALELKSMLKGDLLVDRNNPMSEERNNRLDPRKRQRGQEAFLHALSSWPPSTSLELHFATIPDLVFRPKGRVLVTLFMRTSGDTKAEVREEIASRYLTLAPILAAHIPEAEFVPVTEDEALRQRMRPFKPTHAMAICRRYESISLSTPVRRLSIGFGRESSPRDEENNVVEYCYPWVPALDDWSKLMTALMGQLDPMQIVVRLNAAAEDRNALEHLAGVIKSCETFLSGGREYQLTLNRQATLIRDASLTRLACLSELAFNVGVFIVAPHPVDHSLANMLGRAITGSYAGRDEDDLFRGGFKRLEVQIEEALLRTFFPESEPFSLTEAACAFRLPSPPLDSDFGLPIRRSRTALAFFPSGRARSDVIELAVNEHQGMIQPIFADPEARMRHTFIVGQTGTGKSSLMESMILQDIRAGRGVAVVDPHGDLVDSVLDKTPSQRMDDVVLFDVLDREKPLGLNLIEWETLDERDLIVDELYDTVDRVYDMQKTGGPIFESNFRGMLRLLMGEGPRGDFVPTVLEFTSCYLNREFREWLKKSVTEPQTLDFIEELERTGGEASLHNLSPYITSKFSRFTHDRTLARIVGQQSTSIDFDDVMNNGKILLVKLGKGRFGSTVSALLANQIVSRFKISAMKRGYLRPEDRRDFIMYIDECHNLPPDNFMELLSEARKYRMALVLATQYTAQLAGEGTGRNSLLSAILGNVGTILVFRMGQEDAVRLAPVVHPSFSPLDIIGLPNWHGYARLQMDRESIPPFSFRTRKDETPVDRRLAARIRELSRRKYGMDAGIVDTQIAYRRVLWKDDGGADADALKRRLRDAMKKRSDAGKKL